MALADYIWLIKLIIQILTLIAQMDDDERTAVALLHKNMEEMT